MLCFMRRYDDVIFVSDWTWIFRNSHHRCLIKKVLLKMLRNSQEDTCARVCFLIKLQASGCQFHKNCKNTFFYRAHPDDCFWILYWILEDIYKKRDLRNTTVKIDRSVSWFNDFEVFLLYLEIVLYLWIHLYLEIV